MEYNDMLKHIHEERGRVDKAVGAILKECGEKTLRPDAPAADPETLKEQGCLFGKAGIWTIIY